MGSVRAQLLADAYERGGDLPMYWLGGDTGRWAAMRELVDEGLVDETDDEDGDLVGFALTEDGIAYVIEEGLLAA